MYAGFRFGSWFVEINGWLGVIMWCLELFCVV